MSWIGGIPEDFEAAYGGLVELVGSIGSGEVSEDLVPERADEYRWAHCRGSAALGGAALRELSYELSSRGLQDGADSYPQELQALALMKAALEPVPAMHLAGNEPSGMVEVALPEQLRATMPNGRGFAMGELQIIFEPSQGPPYGYMSVSHPRRYPTYEELCRAARHRTCGYGCRNRKRKKIGSLTQSNCMSCRLRGWLADGCHGVGILYRPWSDCGVWSPERK